MPTSWKVTPHRYEHGNPATTGDEEWNILDLDDDLVQEECEGIVEKLGAGEGRSAKPPPPPEPLYRAVGSPDEGGGGGRGAGSAPPPQCAGLAPWLFYHS